MLQSYGLANVELQVPASERSVYAMGSLTKQFTAAAMLALVEQGKIDLSASVDHVLPNLPKAWEAVRVTYLLSHTSGIPSFTDVGDYQTRLREDRGPKELLKLLLDLPLKFSPGERWEYSNSNYLLLGLLIEQLSGETYQAFMHRQFFSSLGSRDTGMNDWRAVIPNRVSGYVLGDEARLRNAPYYSTASPFSAGGLVSSARDIAVWLVALVEQTILKRESIEAMWTPQRLNDGTACGYGYGWWIADQNGDPVAFHDGHISGFSCAMICYPNQRLAVAVLCNAEHGQSGQLAGEIAKLYTEQSTG